MPPRLARANREPEPSDSVTMRSGFHPHRASTIGVAAVAVLAIAVTSVWALSHSTTTAKAKATTFTVRSGDLSVVTSAAGTVQPINSRALTFGASGTLATLKVKAGTQVESGEVLATIDPTDAQAAVDSAQQALDAANTNLTLAKQQAAAPTPTATPTCADQPASLQTGNAANPTPTPSPSKTGKSPSPSQTCSSRGSTTGQGSQTGGNSQGSDNLLRAEQTVNNDELMLEQAQAKLDGTSITAPIDGRVLSVGGAVGDSVSAGGSGFIVLGGLDSLAIQASFSEADVAAIQIGQAATVSLANHVGTVYKATVTQIDPAGTTSGTLVKYGVQLAFDPVPSGLLLGQSANVAVTTGSVTGVLYVPTVALHSAVNGTATVTVRTENGDVARTVTTGFEGDQGTEIKTGLSAGDVVVLTS